MNADFKCEMCEGYFQAGKDFCKKCGFDLNSFNVVEDKRELLNEMKPQLNTALTSYTKEQLYKILTNLSSNWQMPMKEWKSYKKTEYYEWILFEIYGEDDDDEVEAWIDGIVKKEKWIFEN